jgi:hypothetical protein
MNLSREEIIALWQGIEVSISCLRLTIDTNRQLIGKKLIELKTLSDKLQSELRIRDKMGWDNDRKSGAV